jgi:hypothetical protein
MPDPEDEDLFVAPEAQDDPQSEPEEEPDEIEVAFEGEEPIPVAAERGASSDLVRNLRAELADRERRLKAFEAPKPAELGPEPTLEAFEYDEGKFRAACREWDQRKAEADKLVASQTAAQQAANANWQRKLETFETQKRELRRPDYDEAQETVAEALNEVQQRAIIAATNNSGAIIYALGKHPGKLAEIAKITDPIDFIAAVVRMEGTVTVTNKRRPPEPEAPVRGSAGVTRGSSLADKELERLEAKARTDPLFDRGEIKRHKDKMAARKASGRR